MHALLQERSGKTRRAKWSSGQLMAGIQQIESFPLWLVASKDTLKLPTVKISAPKAGLSTYTVLFSPNRGRKRRRRNGFSAQFASTLIIGVRGRSSPPSSPALTTSTNTLILETFHKI